MKDIFDLFEIETVKNKLFRVMEAVLKEFSLSKENENVYAVALDCQSEGGSVWLKYMSKMSLETILKEEYSDYPKSMIYGLGRLEYSVGDFVGLAYTGDEEIKDKSNSIADFFDIYRLVIYGHFYDNSCPFDQLKATNKDAIYKVVKNSESGIFDLIVPDDKEEEFEEILDQYRIMFWDIVLNCALRLKEHSHFIDKTDDFIIFVFGDWDETENEIMMKKTIDENLYRKLLNKVK